MGKIKDDDLPDKNQPSGPCRQCGYPKDGNSLYPRWRCGSFFDGVRIIHTDGCRLLAEQQAKINQALDAVESQAGSLMVPIADGRTMSLAQYIRIATGKGD